MKKFFKLLGIIALVVIIGFSMAACGGGGDDDDNGNGNGERKHFSFLTSTFVICYLLFVI